MKPVNFLFWLIVFFILAGCLDKQEKTMMLALSKGSPDSLYSNYYNWIKSADSTIVCRDMYAMPLDSAMVLFKSCSGLILTGGTDIDPAFYGKGYDTVRCWTVDDHRDKLEMTLIDSAIAWGMPILGICRGHQVINVALGGSLYVDIPEDFGTSVTHQCEDYLACFHKLNIEPGSLLEEISGVTAGEVNSNHHQAVDKISPQLIAIALSPDGLIEAETWKDHTAGPFLLGIQWHPERMESSNPLSAKVRERFLLECREFLIVSR